MRWGIWKEVIFAVVVVKEVARILGSCHQRPQRQWASWSDEVDFQRFQLNSLRRKESEELRMEKGHPQISINSQDGWIEMKREK